MIYAYPKASNIAILDHLYLPNWMRGAVDGTRPGIPSFYSAAELEHRAGYRNPTMHVQIKFTLPTNLKLAADWCDPESGHPRRHIDAVIPPRTQVGPLRNLLAHIHRESL